MGVNTLSKIELGNRGVDVDELVALALALETTPNRLILTPDASADPVDLTPELATSREHAWRWATGEDEVLLGDEGEPILRPKRRFPDIARLAESRPHRPIDTPAMEEVLRHAKGLVAVRRALLMLEQAGMTRTQAFEALKFLDVIESADDQQGGEDAG